MKPYPPHNGDIIYCDDPKSPVFGMKGIIKNSKEGRVYNYDCDYDYTIELTDTKEIIELSSEQVSYDPPKKKKNNT